jgi:hypothetical protein
MDSSPDISFDVERRLGQRSGFARDLTRLPNYLRPMLSLHFSPITTSTLHESLAQQELTLVVTCTSRGNTEQRVMFRSLLRAGCHGV